MGHKFLFSSIRISQFVRDLRNREERNPSFPVSLSCIHIRKSLARLSPPRYKNERTQAGLTRAAEKSQVSDTLIF